MTNEPVDERLARQVAAVAFADVRTVRRVLRGEPVRGFVGQRIREAVERLRRIQVDPRDAVPITVTLKTTHNEKGRLPWPAAAREE